VTGALYSFEVDSDPYKVFFKSPGRNCDATIHPDGGTEVKIETFGLVARINDLHRGRDAGEPWRWMIDLSAIVILLAAITGVILWLALPKRRNLGIIAMVLGIAICVAFYWMVVP
jgi:hypothetical protein